MKKLILLFAALCITVSIWAYDFTVDGIYYDITSSSSPYTAAVTVATDNANSYSGDVTIPSSVTSSSISYSVTSIGTYAFALSTGLTSVTFPTSVNSIGDGVFWGCTSIATISIPASVKKIGNYVFFGCLALTQIDADAANTNFSSVDGVLYNKDKSTLLVYPAGKPDVSYTIASTVDTIGSCAFGYCKNLTSITIPTSVVYITHAAFMQCNGLTTMFIPASVTYLNNNPFYDCAGMTTVTVDPANQDNESVDGVLFSKGLTTIMYYPPAHSGSNYVIPSTVDYVREGVFMNCTGLTSVTIPSSVTTIRSRMFSGCTGMTSINAYSPAPIDLVTANHPGHTSDAVFQGVDTTTCVLHVPVGSKSLYASAFQWKGFTNIVEDLTSGVSTAHWEQTNCPHTSRVTCLATSGTNVFAGFQDDGIYLSTDNGATWSEANTGLTNHCLRDIAISGSNIYAATPGSGIFLSTDNGSHWTAINTGITNDYATSVLAISPYVTAGTNGGGVFTSSDNGSSWIPNNTGLTNLNVSCLTMVGSTTLFAGTNGGGVFVFNYTLLTWSEVNTGLTNMDIYSLASDGTNIYAGTQGGGVFKSANLGANWTAVNAGLTFNYVTSLSIDANNIFAGTNGAGVFRSADAGTNWVGINNGFTTLDIYSLDMSGTNLYAGTDAAGIWKRDLSEITEIDKINISNNITVYPNPATDAFQITGIEGTATITVSDLSGRLLLSKNVTANATVSVNTLPNGIYLVAIKSNNAKKTEKLVIQH